MNIRAVTSRLLLLVILGIAGLLYGVVPGAVGLTWVVVAYVFVMGFFAPLWDLPQWVLNISPLEHIPGIPLEDLVLTPLVLLTLASLVLTLGALASFRRRDLVAT